MFENELLLRTVFQHDGVLVKRAHATIDLCAVQQMHSYVLAGRQCHVEKRFLDTDNSHGFAKN